jgi:hypothetical protein
MIPLSTQNSDMQNYAQVNDLSREFDARKVVQMFKDTSGIPRIIIGKLPDGTHGLVISKEGVDVTTVFD